MANQEHVNRLKRGVQAWNAWRDDNPGVMPNLSHTDLQGANLSCAYLQGTNLCGADLRKANLSEANLSFADLRNADLQGANLREANLGGGANLSRADLGGADLSQVNLNGANLGGANLSEAILWRTIFGDVDLTSVTGLDTCIHEGPSTIDHHTLQKSGHLPISFLRGVGLPDRLIEYLPSIFTQGIQLYSCFISYSTKDQEFTDRLHADLQNNGVRCWLDKHDLRIGDKTLDAINEAIKLRDKLLLILSEHSIKSEWVEDEVTKAYAEKRKRGQIVLFPIRIDNAIMTTEEAWAEKLRDGRHVGDFREWKDHGTYKKSLERVLRDLTKPEVSPQVP